MLGPLEKTDANILRVARDILGNVPMRITRPGDKIILIVGVGPDAKSYLVRDSQIVPERLAFDRID